MGAAGGILLVELFGTAGVTSGGLEGLTEAEVVSGEAEVSSQS